LTDANLLGASFVCPQCGGMTTPEGTQHGVAPPKTGPLSPARNSAREASRCLFAVLLLAALLIPVLVVVAATIGPVDLLFSLGAPALAFVVVVLTFIAHWLRQAAVAADGKPYWENLL
jgi:hypothetical protein